jgi:hypothetical protein
MLLCFHAHVLLQTSEKIAGVHSTPFIVLGFASDSDWLSNELNLDYLVQPHGLLNKEQNLEQLLYMEGALG